MDKPSVRFTQSGEYSIAYQVVGSGRQDLVYLPGWFSNVSLHWEIPIYARFLERLASFSRLIMLDRRGVGCSDRYPAGTGGPMEEHVDDLLAVLEATNSHNAALFGVQEQAFGAMLAAAAHPSRVSRLILMSASPSFTKKEDLPDEWTVETHESEARAFGRITDMREYIRGFVRRSLPSLGDDERMIDALAVLGVNTMSPSTAAVEQLGMSRVDLRKILPSIRVRTLVIHRTDDPDNPASSARYLAEHIPDAEFREIPGEDALPWAGDHEPVIEAVQGFLGAEPARRRQAEHVRELVTVLFTDIVGSTETAAKLGDAAWKELLADHDEHAKEEIERHRGRYIHTTGDGLLATFDGPARAVRCAQAIGEAVRSLGVEIRSGCHTGEIELSGDDVSGIAVHIGARVAALAGPAEVFVSSTVKDLVAGSGLSFEDAGEHELKGVPDHWHLYRVVG